METNQDFHEYYLKNQKRQRYLTLFASLAFTAAAFYILYLNQQVELKNQQVEQKNQELLAANNRVEKINDTLKDKNKIISNFFQRSEEQKLQLAQMSDSLIKLHKSSLKTMKSSPDRNTTIRFNSIIEKIDKKKPTIYIQYAPDQKGEVEGLRKALSEAYIVPPAELINSQFGLSVRYFSEKDRAAAQKVADVATAVTGKNYKVQQINMPAVKNQIEIWIGNL